MCHLGRSGLLIWSMGQACGVDLAVSVALVVGEAVSLQFVWRSSCGGDVLVRESSTGTRGISGGFECSALKYPVWPSNYRGLRIYGLPGIDAFFEGRFGIDRTPSSRELRRA
jgi:hypothetical protein